MEEGAIESDDGCGVVDVDVKSIVGQWVDRKSNHVFLRMDRTNMSTQVSDTWIDGVAGVGVALSLAGFSNINVSNFCAVRVNDGISIASSGAVCNNFLTNVKAAAVTNNGFGLQSGCSGISGAEVAGSNSYGIFQATAVSYVAMSNVRLVGGATICFVGQKSSISGSIVIANGATNIQFNSNSNFVQTGLTSVNAQTTNVSVIGSDNWFAGEVIVSNAQNGVLVSTSYSNYFESLTTSLHSVGGIVSQGAEVRLRRMVSTSDVAAIASSATGGDGFVGTNDLTVNAVPLGPYAFTAGLTVVKDAVVVNTAGGESFRVTLQAAAASAINLESRASVLRLFRARVVANQLVTVRAWMRRSSTSLNVGLELLPGQVAGALSGVISYMSAAINTWQQVTLTFTPTEAGFVTIHALFWGIAGMRGSMM